VGHAATGALAVAHHRGEARSVTVATRVCVADEALRDGGDVECGAFTRRDRVHVRLDRFACARPHRSDGVAHADLLDVRT